MNEDELRVVAAAPGYRVSGDGVVWTKRNRSGWPAENWRPMKPGIIPPIGYRFVVLYNGGVKRNFYIHRLVLEAFVGPCPPGMEACHCDGDPSNNHVGNLRWDTRKENVADIDRHGRKRRGPLAGGAKLNELSVKAVIQLSALGWSCADLGMALGVTAEVISRVRRGDSYIETVASLKESLAVLTTGKAA